MTSELSIDLVNLTGSGNASLRCEAVVLAMSGDAALASSSVRDIHGALVAAATTWCRFIAGGHDERQTYPEAPKPPPELSLNELLAARPPRENQSVAMRFTPTEQCANDLGTLHGGVALAAAIDVGLTWLRLIYGDASTSSVRVNLLRPASLTDPIDIDATPIHIGRNVAVARVISSSPLGKPTSIATVTGTPLAAITKGIDDSMPYSHRSARVDA